MSADEVWMEAMERVQGFRHLESGWDSYGAHPIGRHTISRTLVLLASLKVAGIACPVVVPCVDGSIQLEWHDPDPDEPETILRVPSA